MMEASRREFLAAGLTVTVAVATRSIAREDPPFELGELTITELQDGMKTGKFTSRLLADKYLARIKALDRAGPASTRRRPCSATSMHWAQ